jgi:hypothetical protein
MKPEEMRALLRKRPFQPIRVHLTDGEFVDIIYPEINLVASDTFAVGVPPVVRSEPWPRAERAILLGWEVIDRVEPLPIASAS